MVVLDAQAGLLDPKLLMTLVSKFSTELSFPVWTQLATDLQDLTALVESREDLLPTYHQFLADLLARVVDHVGWDAKPGEGTCASQGFTAKYVRVGWWGRGGGSSQCWRCACFVVTVAGHVDALLRMLVLKFAGGVDGLTSVSTEAASKFHELCGNEASVAPGLRDIVMNIAVANGGARGVYVYAGRIFRTSLTGWAHEQPL